VGYDSGGKQRDSNDWENYARRRLLESGLLSNDSQGGNSRPIFLVFLYPTILMANVVCVLRGETTDLCMDSILWENSLGFRIRRLFVGCENVFRLVAYAHYIASWGAESWVLTYAPNSELEVHRITAHKYRYDTNVYQRLYNAAMPRGLQSQNRLWGAAFSFLNGASSPSAPGKSGKLWVRAHSRSAAALGHAYANSTVVLSWLLGS
jgi:hypothetical protein